MQNNGIKYGLILGVVIILIYLSLYFIGPLAVVSGASWVAFVAEIILVSMAIKAERKSLGGFIDFKKGLGTGFLTFVLGVLIGTLFQYVLYNFIATDFSEIVREATMDAMDQFSDFMPEDQMDQMEEIMEKSSGNQFKLPTLLGGYLFKLIIPGFPIAALAALIIKKERNDFA